MTATASTVVLFGGGSSERLVSVASAQNVCRHLPDAAPWFLSKTGEIFLVPREALAAHEKPFENELVPAGPAAFPSLDAALEAPGTKGATFFLALHGGEGENGLLQAKLEAKDLAFTGSGSRSSAAAFDKVKAKAMLGAKGASLAMAREFPPMSSKSLLPLLLELLSAHPRWVLKPVADGSSYGLVHLRKPSEVIGVGAKLEQVHVRYLAEQYVEGRELTVGVIDEGPSCAPLPVSEVELEANASFDYAGKYLGKGTTEVTPARLSRADWDKAQALAVLAHTTVGCFGYSRTDMILTGDGPVFLEINTLPGLTKASFIPQQLEAAGRDLGRFLQMQLELARARRDGLR